MDTMRGQGGIQMLLTAVQDAQQIVFRARNVKLVRLKQEMDEAELEATAYHTSLEKEYEKKVFETSGSSRNNMNRLEEETETKIGSLKDAASSIVPMLWTCC